VCVPAGVHTVRYEFRPTSFYAGVIVSAVGWAIWLALGGFAVWRYRRALKEG
jgi:hypothetical protein